MMTGQKVIDFIKENHLENAPIMVEARICYDTGWEYHATDEVLVSESFRRIRIEHKGKTPTYKDMPVILFDAGSNLY